MCSKLGCLITLVFGAHFCNGALLLWSKQKLEISPLKVFNDDTFNDLLEDLGHPLTTIYKSSSAVLLPEFKQILEGYHSAYSPNGEISTENATELSGDDDGMDLLKVKEDNDNYSKGNFLSVIVIPTANNNRIKREAVEENEEPPKEQVVYKGKSKKDIYGLLYSSQRLLLKMNNSNLYLGPTSPDMISVDTINRDSYSRLNVNIPLEEGGKVTLRFIFAWLSSYWSLTTVKITDTNNNLSYNLTTDQDVTAPAHFSYHCNGVTVFTDTSNNVELFIYDIQVQIDSANGLFSDAYDCVDFTTPVIWSGVLVAFILGLGLIVALVAISDIKTMDKFDNQKTKQLAITVTE